MSGNKEGGQKMLKTIYARYGSDYFKRVGKIGGSRSKLGYFGWLKIHDPEKLSEISRKHKKRNT